MLELTSGIKHITYPKQLKSRENKQDILFLASSTVPDIN